MLALPVRGGQAGKKIEQEATWDEPISPHVKISEFTGLKMTNMTKRIKKPAFVDILNILTLEWKSEPLKWAGGNVFMNQSELQLYLFCAYDDMIEVYILYEISLIPRSNHLLFEWEKDIY